MPLAFRVCSPPPRSAQDREVVVVDVLLGRTAGVVRHLLQHLEDLAARALGELPAQLAEGLRRAHQEAEAHGRVQALPAEWERPRRPQTRVGPRAQVLDLLQRGQRAVGVQEEEAVVVRADEEVGRGPGVPARQAQELRQLEAALDAGAVLLEVEAVEAQAPADEDDHGLGALLEALQHGGLVDGAVLEDGARDASQGPGPRRPLLEEVADHPRRRRRAEPRGGGLPQQALSGVYKVVQGEGGLRRVEEAGG
mmetsp:Transcript_54159/g.118074  ORF Transcript_54159/g.118074 Transcript_54159/m.118074 type:complete len:252 (-) Transcript_54159:389-1144(-)